MRGQVVLFVLCGLSWSILIAQEPPGPLPADSNWQHFGYALDWAEVYWHGTTDGKRLYFGGAYFQVGGQPGEIFSWDTERQQLQVLSRRGGRYSLLMWAEDTLYAFSSMVDGIPTQGFALWDGQRWHIPPMGPNGVVSFAVRCGDTLYAAGGFTAITGPDTTIPVRGFAKYHLRTRQWSVWGSGKGLAAWRYYGLTGLRGLAVDTVRKRIAVVGLFDTIDGTAAMGIAVYDIQQGRWEGIRGPSELLYGYAVMACEWLGDTLLVGGILTTFAGKPVCGLVGYDLRMRQWVELPCLPGTEPGRVCPVLLMGKVDGKPYVHYYLYSPQGVMRGSVALWEGGRWRELFPEGCTQSVALLVAGMERVGGTVYAAGFIPLPSGAVAQIARWDSSSNTWQEIPELRAEGGYAYPDAHSWRILVRSLLKRGDTLIVGGLFRTAGQRFASGVALYDIRRRLWHPLGSCPEIELPGVTREDTLPGRTLDGGVYTMLLVRDDLYVGGRFVQAGGKRTYGLARYNFREGRWYPMGITDPEARVYALAQLGDSLYVAGFFQQVDTIRVGSVAIWDLQRQRWYPVEDGGIRGVAGMRTITGMVAFQGKIYISGDFRSAGGQEGVDKFAVWDGQRWRKALGDSAPGVIVDGLTVTPWGMVFAVPGEIRVGEQLLRGVVLYDGESFRVVTPRTTNRWAIAADTATGTLVSGGAGQLSRIFLDGRPEVVLGSGVQHFAREYDWQPGRIYALLCDADGCWVGGAFLYAGRRLSQALAYWRRESTGVVERSEGKIAGRIYPVPALEEVVLEYELQHGGEAVLELLDGLGRVVERRLLGWRAAGQQRERLGLAGLASGVYYWRLRAGTELATGTLVVVR